MALLLAVAVAFAFDLSNGFHDSANAIAALVVTRAATPIQAVALAATFHILGPLVAGTAVASTVAGIITVPDREVVLVVGSALTAALAWNLGTWWRGLPSSSSHGLVGGLTGAALAAHGPHAVRWGGVAAGRPSGVLGILAGLALSPVLGFGAGWIASALAQRSLRRATKRVVEPIRRAQWATASALAFSHGANDAQKTMGVVTLLLLAEGHLDGFSVPLWVKLAAAASLTIGTALGGWRIVRTLGSSIYRLRPLDGLVGQGSAASVIMSAAALGAPVSTTHVVASSIVGVGTTHGHRNVRWAVVKEMAVAWVVTLPATALLGALVLPIWRLVV